MVTICLNMIVKNESKIIKRLLDSVYKIIDYWVIVDTGSTDNTKEIIKNYFSEKNIPGELHEKEFINFGINRTHALKLAKNKADFLFFMDADHVLKYDDSFSKEQLKFFDEINIQLKTGSLKYYLIRFLRANMEINSVGVTHEYYEYDKKDAKIANFKNIWIDDYGDGGTRHLKFDRDIKLLKESVKKNPNNTRDLFYLAESLKHKNNFEEAIEYYKRRVNFNNFSEERWYALYMIGNCYLKLKNEKEGIYWCLEAYKYRSKRSESLYCLSEYYTNNKNYNLADIFCKIGSKIKYPKNEILFVNEDIYNYKYDYLKSEIYKNIKSNENISKDLNMTILKNIPQNYFWSILNNIRYYSISLLEKLNVKCYNYNNIFNKVVHSILNYKNRYLVINKLNPVTINTINIETGIFNKEKECKNYNLHYCKICTNCIKVDEIYVFIIYHKYGTDRLHKFVGLNENLDIVLITESFYLNNITDERIFEISNGLEDDIEIYWSKEDKISYKTNIRKKTFKNYLFQYIL